MLDARVAVDDLVHVVVKLGAAFRHDHDAQGAAGGDHLLALLAARLLVALDRDRTDVFQTPDVEFRVLQTVDLGVVPPGVGSVQDRSGGVDTRRHDLTRPLQLGRGKDAARVVRRIVKRRHAEGQVGKLVPVLLGRDLGARRRDVGVDVHESRNDRLARHVDLPGVGGNGDLAGRSHGLDSIAANEHDAVLDHLLDLLGIPHRHDPGTRKGDRPIRLVRGHAEPEIDPFLDRLGELLRGACHEAEGIL